MLKLGDVAKDGITGYQGIIIAVTYWMHGCIRYGLQAPMKKDGKIPDVYTIDEPQVQIVKSSKKTVKSLPLNINLGDTAKDEITGAKGIIEAYSIQISGETHVALQDKQKKDGDVPKLQWFNQSRIKIVKSVKKKKPKPRHGKREDFIPKH